MSRGKYVIKERKVWRRIVWRKRRANHIENKKQ